MTQTRLNPNQITVATDATLTGDGSLASPLHVIASGTPGIPGGTQGDVQFNNSGTFAGDTDLTWDDANNVIELGGANWYTGASRKNSIQVTTTPVGASSNVILGHTYLDGTGNFTGVPTYGGDRAGGSKATPTAVLDNMGLARFVGGGYDGTALSGTSGQVVIRSAGNWASGSHPTSEEIWTTPTGTTTRALALTVGADGNPNITGTYNVNGSPHMHTGLVTNGDSHDHVGGDGAVLPFLFPFATYINLNPITADAYPYAGTAEAAMSFVKWWQNVYTGSNHSATNFYTLNLYMRYTTTSSDVLMATLETKTCVTGANLLSTTTITAATGGGFLYIRAFKNATAPDIYLICPALWCKLT
jgi:hypothetical protein